MASPLPRIWDPTRLPLAIAVGLRLSLGLVPWAVARLFPAPAVPAARAPYLLAPDSAVVAPAVANPRMVWRDFPWPYIVYACSSGALMVWIESSYSPLQAANRYVIVVFPLFVLLGVAGGRQWIDRLIITLFAPLQGFLLLYFVQYRFVG